MKTILLKLRSNIFLTNSLILFAGAGFVGFLNYFFHLVIGRLLDVQSFGEVESLISLGALLGLPAGTITMVVTKYCAELKAKQEFGKMHALISFLDKRLFYFSVLATLTFLVLSLEIQSFLNIRSVWPIIISFIPLIYTFLYAINRGALAGLQRFKELSIIGVIDAGIKLIFVVLFALLAFGVSGAMGGIMLGGLVGYAVSFYAIKFIFSHESDQNFIAGAMDRLKGFAWAVFLFLIGITLFNNLDLILVKHYFSPEMAGYYSALSVLGKIIFFSTGIITSVMFPMVSEAHKNNNQHGHILKSAIILVGLISLGIVLFYALFPGFAIQLLLGSKYLVVGPYLKWFALAMLSFSFVNLLSQYFLSQHQTSFVYWILLVAPIEWLAISLFHDSLGQVILILNILMGLSLAMLIFYYFRYNKVNLNALPASDINN